MLIVKKSGRVDDVAESMIKYIILMNKEDILARCLRCYGYILNLIARAFIFGKDYEVFENQTRDYGLIGQYKR